MRPFREHHLLTLLEEYEQSSRPIDASVASYFRTHRSLGSKDRAYIAEQVYTLIRWKGLIDWFCKENDWESRIDSFRSLNLNVLQQRDDLPIHIRLSFPKELYERLVNSLGADQTNAFCLASNTKAPVTVRTNPLKTSRDDLLNHWKNEGYLVRPCAESPFGIIFEKSAPLFSLPEFKKGLFEMQDEASQLVAFQVQAKPGDHVLDFCAGAGGKALAFAHQLEGKGQVYLHDIRPWALDDAKKRFKRSGVQNVQFLPSEAKGLKALKKKMDWVIVDVPCTGTGTLRRNPDMKWSYHDEDLKRLVGEQRTIFEQALSYLKPGGKIVYSTCSVLKEENQEQINHFQETYSLNLACPPFESFPEEGGKDGFFAATLAR